MLVFLLQSGIRERGKLGKLGSVSPTLLMYGFIIWYDIL